MIADDEIDFFGLFLALGEARVADARGALDAEDVDRLRGALVPLAVDAALLGAEGVAHLARAIVDSSEGSPPAPREARREALDALGAAVGSLGRGDASGARADEARLRAIADALSRGVEPKREAPAPARETTTTRPDAVDDDTTWIPALPEDLIGPFLDECQERIEGLSARLLEIEQEGTAAAGGEAVRALFRDLHTLKGSSGFAGLTRMNRLAHAAEDLVAKIRDGVAVADRPAIDVLLSVVDRFRAIVERAAMRAPIDVEVDDVIGRLRDPRAPAPKKTILPDAPAPGAPPTRPQASGAGTLRVEFERVDQLQNFVNELVLARSRLVAATSGQLGLGRELARLRRKLAARDEALRAVIGEDLRQELGRVERVLDEGALELEAALGTLGTALGQLRERVMRLRMVPIARLFTKHQRTVRELGRALGKQVRLELRGQETELDKFLVEQLEDPLVHLVRNAVDHGLEPKDVRVARGKPEVGTVSLRARQQGSVIVVEVEDDGAGIDPARLRAKAVEKGIATSEEVGALDDREALELIFRPGFSTAAALTDVSGRGVGMDVVRESISRLKGTIEIRSTVGVGTTFELRLPLTLAVAQVLIVRAGGEDVALPIDAVSRSLAIGGDGGATIEDVAGRPCLVETLEGVTRRVPIVELAPTLGLDGPRRGDARSLGAGERGGHLVVIEAPLSGVEAIAVACDALVGRHDVVVKPLGPLLAQAPFVAGASLVGDRVVLLVDVAAVARRGLERPPTHASTERAERPSPRRRALVAEDADVVREAIRRALEGAGFEVVTARDGEEALARARQSAFDVITTDAVMPRLDGYELTRRLRSTAEHARTPIVMVTSKDQRVDVLRGHDAGVDAYVTKPADVRGLLRTIEDLLART